MTRRTAVAALLLLLVPASLPAAPTPVVIDTDIGDGIDDAFALALALSSPELDVRGVTTVGGDAHTRALSVCRLLHEVGRREVPVAAGKSSGPTDFQGQMQYGLRPAFRKGPEKAAAVEFLYRQLKERPGELTLLCIGPLTNVAELLNAHPDCKPWVNRLVLMGGSVRVGYNGKPPAEPEWNVSHDVAAARAVFESGLPLVVCPVDATAGLRLEGERLRKVLHANSPLTWQLRALYQLWDEEGPPTLWDPAAVALAFQERFFTLEDLRLEVDDRGMTREAKGKPNAHVATGVKAEEFLKWFVQRLAPGESKPAVPLKSLNVSAPVPHGGLPPKVHVSEDYETDIERRWWLCGKLETENVPPGSKRACRGVLTNDFDDLQGDPAGMYTAVIFNPVPGPPMGPNTRLGFRCWLKGTDRLRVQIYSLSKGYHRCLTLTELPQGKWQELTVDMTALRRPDGSGGPLSADERIDDVQFYTDPDAELIVDDVVLYDAAPKEETRPFPKRLLFTGWFDTGRQGQEWPGDFEIVPHRPPLTWKAAKSVPRADTGEPWVRMSLRGERPLGETTQLRFRYHLTGADTLRVELVNRTARDRHVVLLKDLQKETWAEATADFSADSRLLDGSPCKPRPGDRVDEVRFLLPKGAELLLDDVLLFEPGGR